MAPFDRTFAAFLQAKGVETGRETPPSVTPEVLAALFADYAGGADPDSLLDALVAQFTLVDLGVSAERGSAPGVDVIYRGADGIILGCEILVGDAEPDPDRLDALITFADTHEALSTTALSHTRTDRAEAGEWVIPLRPIAVEAMRVGLRSRG